MLMVRLQGRPVEILRRIPKHRTGTILTLSTRLKPKQQHITVLLMLRTISITVKACHEASSRRFQQAEPGYRLSREIYRSKAAKGGSVQGTPQIFHPPLLASRSGGRR